MNTIRSLIIFLLQHNTSCFTPCSSETNWEMVRNLPCALTRLYRFSFQQAGNLCKTFDLKNKTKRFSTSHCHPCLLSNDPKHSCSDPSVFFPPSHAVMSVTELSPPITLNSSACLTGTNQTSKGWKKRTFSHILYTGVFGYVALI